MSQEFYPLDRVKIIADTDYEGLVGLEGVVTEYVDAALRFIGEPLVGVMIDGKVNPSEWSEDGSYTFFVHELELVG